MHNHSEVFVPTVDLKVTVLDGLTEYVDSDKITVMQMYGAYKMDVSEIYNHRNQIVVFLAPGEYHNTHWLDEILCRSKSYHEQTGNLNNYYVMIHCHDYPDSIKQNYGEYFTLIKDPYLYSFYTDKIPKINTELLKNSTKRLHFLSLNNRASDHRASLYYFFEKFSLREKSYFSYQGDIERSPYNTHDELSALLVDGEAPWYLKNLNLAELNRRIPVTIDTDPWNGNDWGPGQDFFYTDTFCSIVTETYTEEMYPYFTEKMFKPLAYFHPFIVSGNKNSLECLQDMGYKTFSKYWDESYDKLQGNRRLEAMFHVILEIGNWSVDKINAVYQDMLPILEHNHNHFYTTVPEIFNSNLPNVFDQIKQIVQDKQRLLG